MWRLTIYQKYKYSYTYEGENRVSEGENDIHFESENIEDLFRIVDDLEKLNATDETRYEIKKVVD